MNQLLQSLKTDHVNLDRLLSLLDRKIDELAGGDDAAVEVLSAIGAYCQDYPGLHHHPAEEAIAERLQLHSPEVVATIGDVVQEHVELAAATQDFVDTVVALGAESVRPRDQVVAELRDFSQRYHRHIEWEESELFPAAEQCLSDADWAAVATNLGSHADALFDGDSHTSYRLIRESLLGDE